MSRISNGGKVSGFRQTLPHAPRGGIHKKQAPATLKSVPTRCLHSDCCPKDSLVRAPLNRSIHDLDCALAPVMYQDFSTTKGAELLLKQLCRDICQIVNDELQGELTHTTLSYPSDDPAVMTSFQQLADRVFPTSYSLRKNVIHRKMHAIMTQLLQSSDKATRTQVIAGLELQDLFAIKDAARSVLNSSI